MLRMAVAVGERPCIPRDTPPDLTYLVQACWGSDPKVRPTMVEVLDDLHTSEKIPVSIFD